ncbi:MAG: BlaI/MecI/CopY family transcriptional regulator [Candidatus Limnocylindrales bacterium]
MTILGRLYERGLLDRTKVGRGYRYRPRGDESELLASMGERAVDQIVERYGTAALRRFAHHLADLDPNLRARLLEPRRSGRMRSVDRARPGLAMLAATGMALAWCIGVGAAVGMDPMLVLEFAAAAILGLWTTSARTGPLAGVAPARSTGSPFHAQDDRRRGRSSHSWRGGGGLRPRRPAPDGLPGRRIARPPGAR